MKANNNQKMREALETIDKNTDLLDIAENIAPRLHPSHAFVAVQIRKIVRTALSEPPRNCDIHNGTGEAMRRYGFPTKSKPWTEADWLKFVDWLYAEAEGEAR